MSISWFRIWVWFVGGVLSLGAAGAEGGGGPCPVPEMSPEFLGAKFHHETPEPVVALDTLAAQRKILARTRSGGLLTWSYGDGQEEAGPLTGLALLRDPLTAFFFPSLTPAPLAPWLRNADTVVKETNHFVAAVAERGIAGTRYRLYEVDADTARPTPLCATPRLPGLVLSKGHQKDVAYFHALRTRGRRPTVEFYQMRLQGCRWRKEPLKALSVASPPEVVRFASHALVQIEEQAVWVRPDGVSRYELRAKAVYPTDFGHPMVLAHGPSGALHLFLPERGVISPLLLDAAELYPRHLSFAEGSRLFIAASAISPDRTGVFEFEIKQPLLGRGP